MSCHKLRQRILAHFLYTFEVSIRASAILGLVGAGGIGLLLKNTLDLFRYDQSCAIVIYTLLIVVIIDLVSTRFRSYLLKGSAKPMSATRANTYKIIGWAAVIGLDCMGVNWLGVNRLPTNHLDSDESDDQRIIPS